MVTYRCHDVRYTFKSIEMKVVDKTTNVLPTAIWPKQRNRVARQTWLTISLLKC